MADYAQIATDLNLRYSGTVVRYRQSSDLPWDTVVIADVVSARGALPQLVLKGLSGTQVISYGTEGEFNFEFPDTGCFNYNGIGLAFFRRPSRQNKRALCAATSVRSNHYTASRLTTVPVFDVFVANAMFNRVYTPKDTAIGLLNARNAYCVAVSSEFMLGLNTRKDRSHLLFHRITPIAEISESGEVSSILHPAFEGKVYEYLS